MMIKDLKTEQWQALNEWLTTPLDDAGKAFVLDMMHWPLFAEKIENHYPTQKTSEIQKELVAFKETSLQLIPQTERDDYQKGYYRKDLLPIDAAIAMQNAYKALACQAKKRINNELWLMLRTTNTEQLQPNQYYTAARLALDSIALKKGRPKEGKHHLYRLVFSLWRDLGETNLKISDEPMTPIVGFSYNLFLTIDDYVKGYRKEPSTIRQDLAKYIKQFSI